MHVQFIKNIQFTKLIKAEGRLREFNFRKLSGINEGFFSVDVVDDRGNRIMFRMHNENNQWVIAGEQVPLWLSKYEHLLNDVIIEELNSVES